MKNPKALVVEHDEKTRQAIDEILSILGHEYDMVASLAEARKLLTADGHAYVIASSEIPARPGCVPRAQNLDYLLEEVTRLKGDRRLPVIVPFGPMPDIEDEDKLRWAADMNSRGATTFVQKPFRTRGRTLDRVIKKLLAGQTESVRLTSVPTAPAKEDSQPNTSVTASAPTSKNSEPSPKQASSATGSAMTRWAAFPNEPLELDDFMAKFCEQRSKENRACRKRALLAAARHGTVKLPPLAVARKHGQSKKYFAHDLLAAWQGYLDEGVDLPPLLPQHRTNAGPDQAA